jgi:hypothetical protein
MSEKSSTQNAHPKIPETLRFFKSRNDSKLERI